MATVAVLAKELARGAYLITWTFPAAHASGDTGEAFDGFTLPDKTLMVSGPTGGTTAVVVEGANTPSNGYVALNGVPGGPTTLSFTAAGTAIVLENPRFIRPRLDTSTGGGTVVVEILAQSGRR